jgi:hypothetical protein
MRFFIPPPRELRDFVDHIALRGSPEDILQGALERSSAVFGECGPCVLYPDGDEDTLYIPCRHVELHFATGLRDPFNPQICTEDTYLRLMAESLRSRSFREAATVMHKFRRLLPQLSPYPYKSTSELISSIVASFPVSEIVENTLARHNFRLGPYGCGVGFHEESYSDNHKKYITIFQRYGKRNIVDEAEYYRHIVRALRRKGFLDAASRIEHR